MFLALRLLAEPADANESSMLKLEEEAPETIFETKIGDADADLRVQGLWDAYLRSSAGISILPGKGVQYPSPFPGFPDGLIYDQKPNLILSLWLMERYFFETTLQENRSLNSYVLGYQGKEGELLQAVRMGNKGIEISPYPYLDFPGGSRSSPGLMARLQTKHTQHEFLLRYDPTQPVKKTYVGKNAVEETRIDPSGFVSGRFFVLPDTEVDGVEVFLEDDKGTFPGSDGRRYRKASDFDASVSRSEGMVSLQKSAAGRVLVYYEKGGLPVGSPTLGKKALPVFVKETPSSPWKVDPLSEGEDFSWSRGPYLGHPIQRFQVTVNGKPSLLLHDPGAFSPFQDNGSYASSGSSLPTGAQMVLKVVRRGVDAPLPLAYPVQPVLVPSESVVRMVFQNGNRRAFPSRFPFAEEAPLLYGPDSRKGGGGVEFEILVQTYTPTQSYTVPLDVIPGSVRVFKNGREEPFFTVDYQKGTVTLPFEPSPSDRIELYYRTVSGKGAGGDVLLGIGNSFHLGEDLEATLALGVRWNVLKGSYSTEADDHPGMVGLSSQLSYKKENFWLTADGAMVYHNPDTSGLLRLLGMEGYDLTLEISKHNSFPASVPDPAFFGGVLSQNNRGKLFFKNYETVDLLGGTTLNPYTWNPPGSAIFPYQSGSFPGPYTASAASEGFGRVLVLDYSLGPGEEWVGAQMNLSSGLGDSLDLSDVSSIRFAYKAVSHSGQTVSLNFQIGALSEDLDGDGILDEEVGPSSRGFSFNQGTLVLYVGAGQEGLGNNQKDSEDANRNGILERDNPDLIFPGPLSTEGKFTIDSPTGWKSAVIRVPYGERNRLKAVRAVRVILRKEGSGSGGSEGKILLGPIVFEGTTLPHRVEGSGEMEAREIHEPLADHKPADPVRTLDKVEPDRIQTFHSGGSDQKVLEVKWKGLSPSSSWVLYSPTREVPFDQYQEINLYIRTAQLNGASPNARYVLEYTDPNGKGARVQIPAVSSNQWAKLTLNVPRKKAYLGDTEIGTVTVDSDAGKLSRFLFKGEGAQEGVVYLDELHMSAPKEGLGLAGSVELSFLYPGTLIRVGGFPLIKNLGIRERIAARTDSFPGHTSEQVPSLFSSTTDGNVDLLGVLRTEAVFGFDKLPSGFQYEGGHRLRLPAEGGGFSLQDQYKRTYNKTEESFSRMNRVEVSAGAPFALTVSAQTLGDSKTLSQTWDASVSSSPAEGMELRGSGKLSHFSEGYSLAPEPYVQSWFRGYQFLYPYTEGLNIQREGSLNGETKFSWEGGAVRLLPELSYLNTGSIDGLQRTGEKLTLEIPLRIRPEGKGPGVSVTFAYLKQGTSSRAVGTPGDFLSDFSVVQKALKDQTYFYRSLPFYELFVLGRWSTFQADTEGLPFAEYISQVKLSFSRPFGSLWFDLLAPSQGEGSFKKVLTRSKDAFTSANQLDLTLVQSAMNLFGEAGPYPLTRLWYSDEYQFKHVFSLQYREEDPAWEWTGSFQQKGVLYSRGENQLAVEHQIRLEKKDTLSYGGKVNVAYAWKGPIHTGWGSKVLDKTKAWGAYYLHTERVEYRYEDKDGWKQYLVLGHETALTFPKRGYIKAELNIGVGFEEDYSGLSPGYRVLLALAGGISAHFTF